MVGDQTADERRGGAGQGSDGIVKGSIQRNFAGRSGIFQHDIIARNPAACHRQSQRDKDAVK